MGPKRFYSSLRFKFLVTLTAILLIFLGGLYYYQFTLRRHQVVRVLEESSKRYLSSIIKESLRHAMLARDLSETQNIMLAVKEQQEVLNIFLVNKGGEVVLAPGKMEKERFSRSEPTCQICHRSQTQDRPHTVVLTDEQGRDLVRNVSPILNDSACHGCHGPSSQVLGMLITDYSLQGVDSQLGWEFRRFAVTLSLVFGLLTAGVGFGLERSILARLRNLLEATRRFGRGDFDQAVAVGSHDEIGELSSAFNYMAVDLKDHIEELKLMERKLVASERLASLGVLSSGAAHHILNPLTNISLTLQVFKKDLRLNPEGQRLYDDMLKEVDRIHSVVRGLNVFAQKLRGDKQEVLLEVVLEKALLAVEANLQERGIRLIKELTPLSAPLIGYPLELVEAFSKIFDNAVKSVAIGGTLTVSAREVIHEGLPSIEIRITDTGVGIRKEHLSKVCDPFFTAWGERYNTLGLGLSIAHGIIEAHDGTLAVESVVGKGTTAKVRLPLAQGKCALGGEETPLR